MPRYLPHGLHYPLAPPKQSCSHPLFYSRNGDRNSCLAEHGNAFYGEVSISLTGQVLPCVYGTVASAFSPILYSVVITLFNPQHYDWADFKKGKLALDKLESELTVTVTVTTPHDNNGHHEGYLEDGRR